MRRKSIIIIIIALFLAGGAIGVNELFSSIYASAYVDLNLRRYDSAKRKYEWLAIFGYSQSRIILGEMHAFGWGIPRNRDEAIKWFRRTGSCEKWANEPAACSAFHVGMRFSEGLGVQLDFEEATWWLEFAKKGGYFPNSMGSRISWSYPNIPPILLAGHLADRDYRDFLFGKTSDKSEDDISSILDNPEYFEIHLREDKNHFLVEIIYKPHENQPLSTFGAKYKIDKERIKISERVLFNE